ncbi:MAG: alpha/beta fold hydrolase [Actinomycetota bacterium]
MPDQFVVAGGARTHFLTEGSGPPVVLLHGLHGLAEHWQWVLPHLTDRVTCYLPEMIGHGRTERIRSDYRLDDYAAHVLAFMSEVGLDRASIVGNSLGGATALRMAALEPGRVNRLVLACPAGLGGSSNTEALRFVGGVLEMLAGVRTRALARWGERNQFADPRRVDPAFFESKEADARSRRSDPVFRKTSLRQARGIATLDRIDTTQIPHPTLVVWGTEDKGLPWENSVRSVDRLPNGRLVLLRGCGHLPHVEQPERFAELALKHLSA